MYTLNTCKETGLLVLLGAEILRPNRMQVWPATHFLDPQKRNKHTPETMTHLGGVF